MPPLPDPRYPSRLLQQFSIRSTKYDLMRCVVDIGCAGTNGSLDLLLAFAMLPAILDNAVLAKFAATKPCFGLKVSLEEVSHGLFYCKGPEFS